LLIGLVGGVPLGFNRGGWRDVNLGRRRAEFRPIETQEIAASDRQAEEELWRKERERRAQDRR
jgi:hypothetical protein